MPFLLLPSRQRCRQIPEFGFDLCRIGHCLRNLLPQELSKALADGASTVFITSLTPVTSYDVFVTTSGDMLIAIGAPTRTPVPGEPGEFTTHVELNVIGGSGKYAEATGAMIFDGTSHTGTVPPTADLIYKGTVCGPNVKGGN